MSGTRSAAVHLLSDFLVPLGGKDDKGGLEATHSEHWPRLIIPWIQSVFVGVACIHCIEKCGLS
jgi:hypothetical protein